MVLNKICFLYVFDSYIKKHTSLIIDFDEMTACTGIYSNMHIWFGEDIFDQNLKSFSKEKYSMILNESL